MATITDTWDSAFEAYPAGSTDPRLIDDAINAEKRATSERGRREHYWTPGANNAKHGLHLPGSAIAYFTSTDPTTRPDGDALDADDEGRLMVDTNLNYAMKVRGDGAWTQITPGMTGTDLALGVGSADRKIYFAGDATLLWDESEDRFIPSKRVGGAKYGGMITSLVESNIFVGLASYIPNVGEYMVIHGAGVRSGTTDALWVPFTAYRAATGTITLYGGEYTTTNDINAVGFIQTYNAVQGNSANITDFNALTLVW